MKRVTTRFFATVLHLFGVDVFTDGTTKHQSNIILCKKIIITIFLLSGMFSMLAYALQNWNDLSKFILGIGYTAADAAVTTNYLYFMYFEKSIRKLIADIDREIFTYTDEPNILPKYSCILKEKNYKLFLIIFMVYIALGTALAAIPAILVYLINERQHSIVVYPSWIPSENGFIGSAFQLSTTFAFAGPMYLAWSFPIFVHLEFQRQCERLCAALATLTRRSLSQMLEYLKKTESAAYFEDLAEAPDSAMLNRVEHICALNHCHRAKYHEIVREQLIECVQHHQHLIR